MSTSSKCDIILDALQKLLEQKSIQNISVSEIAQTAGIGKGSIYYYFPSKNAILDALIERNYKKPLETVKNMAKQTNISSLTRMSMMFQACRSSSTEFMIKKKDSYPDTLTDAQEESLLHKKYLTHVISELKPVLTEIIKQGIAQGEFSFDHPAALAEIVLIVLAVKLDNTIMPSTPTEIEETICGLVSLLEKGSGNCEGALNFLISSN